jgi:transposase InsO family protein
MLVELSVVEQRYHAVMEVLAGAPVTEVALRYGVSRKSVHAWVGRYGEGGLAGLVDRSHRPHGHPWQVAAVVEALIVQMRTDHRRWGPRRLCYELGRAGVQPVPSRSTIYRVLVRHGLVSAQRRRRRREDYRRWERSAPMDLWQMDVMGSVRLVDGSEAKLISGVDDHSRYAVIATVVGRATGRAVCAAFAAALTTYGVPEQVLTDNGKQFTGKYGRPRPAEVLFDQICRRNGIEHLLTAIRSPTTTGKVERWHQSIQRELLDDHPPFVSVAHAQEVVTAWQVEYNTTRPHQSLGMSTPAERFKLGDRVQPERLPLWVPPDLPPVVVVAGGQEQGPGPLVENEPETPVGSCPGAVELEREVPPSGNLSIGRQQVWFGPARAGEVITAWVDSTTIHLSSSGRYLKTIPSRLNERDMDRLRRAGARTAGPPPARPLPGKLLAGQPIEVDRVVTTIGMVSLGDQQFQVGSPLAGQRVTIRLEGQLAYVILGDGSLWRTAPFTLPAPKRARLQGARPAGAPPQPPQGPTRVQRHVSSRGTIQVVGQRVQVGLPHAGTIVTVEVEESSLRVLDEHEIILRVVPRLTRQEVTRHKAYGRRSFKQA